ncbi:hypothetical protein KUCAC02_032041 [Chaenocephalus aceratus]|nr:hypothetical protein KUCAC02_032041 [Chaenocephalus aceratus]
MCSVVFVKRRDIRLYHLSTMTLLAITVQWNGAALVSRCTQTLSLIHPILFRGECERASDRGVIQRKEDKHNRRKDIGPRGVYEETTQSPKRPWC